MIIDLLTIEIGSTITKVNAFNGLGTDNLIHVGQGIALTTVDTDVRIGVENAKNDLMKKINTDSLDIKDIVANSSAAGGLKMVATGLTWEMTARAAKEAALGAGAVLKYLTAGPLTQTDLNRIKQSDPNMILFAGGVDYGEQQIILENARKIAELNLSIPIIFAGNKVVEDEIKNIFLNTNYILEIVPNVYPSIDQFNIDPTRKAIQHIFSKHIIHAKGIDKLQEIVKKEIIPTPYAVLKITKTLYEKIGDLVIIDVGGATTDVHSVTEGSLKYKKLLIAPEPFAKRTVEGDLGVYVNASNVKKYLDEESIGVDLQKLSPLPKMEEEVYLSLTLADKAVRTAIERHCGQIIETFGPDGRKQFIKGKDLTATKYIIGSGGALTRLKNAKQILENIRITEVYKKLLPLQTSGVLIDTKYILSACGTFVDYYKDDAIKLALKSVEESLLI